MVCFHFFPSIFWICVQFQNSWTSQLAIIFFLWRECRLRQCYRNYSWFTGGIKTFKGGLNCEKLYCPPNVNTWAMESFVVQFRKSKVSSHRRNVHVSWFTSTVILIIAFSEGSLHLGFFFGGGCKCFKDVWYIYMSMQMWNVMESLFLSFNLHECMHYEMSLVMWFVAALHVGASGMYWNEVYFLVVINMKVFVICQKILSASYQRSKNFRMS